MTKGKTKPSNATEEPLNENGPQGKSPGAPQLLELLDQKREEVAKLGEGLQALTEEILQHLTIKEHRKDILARRETLARQEKECLAELAEPHISIAVAGTTSSGKSTFVNWLCGEELMPVAVQEMSAGVVVIEHDDGAPSLTIHPTPGAQWESGTWDNISPSEIVERLERTMNIFLDLRNKNKEPAAPRMEVRFPTRIGAQARTIGLPPRCKLRILDLPGLKFLGDLHNKEIIKTEAQKSFCILTVNSEDTDDQKRQALLQELVGQVKELRGSPARMLFIANRFDAFSTDTNSETSAQRFRDNVLDEIKKTFGDAGYKEESKQLDLHPFCSLPAVKAWIIMKHSQREIEVVAALEYIEGHYGFMLQDYSWYENLPRKVEKWIPLDRARVADAVWEKSRATRLDHTIAAHLRRHAPEIILSPILQPLQRTALECLAETVNMVKAHAQAGKADYERECARIDEAREDLEKMREKERQELHVLETAGDNPAQAFGNLSGSDAICRRLEERYSLKEDTFNPLYRWWDEIGKVGGNFLLAIGEMIRTGNFSNDVLVQSLPPETRQALTEVCQAMKSFGFEDKYLSQGGTEKAATDQEKARLKELNKTLIRFSEVTEKALTLGLDRTAERETGRIHDAFTSLTQGCVRWMERKSREIAPDLSGITPPMSDVLARLDPIKWNINLRLELAVVPDEELVQCGVREILDHMESVAVKRPGCWGWIKDCFSTKYEARPVYRKEPDFKKRSIDCATIPSLDQIMSICTVQILNSKMEETFCHWLSRMVRQFLQQADRHQNEALAGYRKRLDEVQQSARVEAIRKEQVWQPFPEKIERIRRRAESLLTIGVRP